MKNKRAGAYFGMHFDFHASDLVKDIGSKTTAEALGKYLDEVKPDYLQVDTKGHPGLASYFSKYGDVAPGLTVDQLKMIREETKKRGILLIAHHSSIWDEAAGANHPEWAIIESDGKVSTGIMDTTSDYVDKKFIFMLKELCGKYGFDGVWVDGDCWCVYENYRPEFVQKFYEESGFESIDKENLSSPSHIAFRKYCKKEFERYVKYYIKEIKRDYPDFEMCSNTAFTNYYPVKPFDEVDFLSADVYDLKYRVIARSFASHNKPWDIMSWGRPAGLPAKESAITGSVSCNNHLDVTMRIAAEAISLGGGFQNIGNMNAEGEMIFYETENMKKLSDFMMERKPFNYGSKPLENAAIWLSEQNRDVAITTGSVCEFDEVDYGLCDVVIDAGRPVDIIFDYHIEEDRISERPAIVIPESAYISDRIKAKLLEYANNGGSLVVTGANSCKIFADQIDAKVKDYNGNAVYFEQKSNPYYMAGCQTAVVFENFNGDTVCNSFSEKMDHSGKPVVTSPVVAYGKGKIIYLGWDITREYYKNHRYVHPHIMNDALCVADKKPLAYLKSGTNRVEIIPAKKDDMLLVNVINTSEFYYFSLKKTYGDIPPICDIEIAVRCGKEPKNIMLQPENKKAEFTYDGEYAYVKLSKLHIHTIIAVEN